MSLDANQAFMRLANVVWNGTLEARVAELLRENEPVVLVTIVQSEGSAPRHAGTRALQTRYGFEGTVGGGILEAQTMKTAQTCLMEAVSSYDSFSFDASHQESDMVCGGCIEVFFEYLAPTQAETFAKADTLLQEGVPAVWMVLLAKKEGSVVYQRSLLSKDALESSQLAKEDPTSLRDFLKQSHPKLLQGTNTTTYLEPLTTSPVLLLCGGGHVSLEVARLAHQCGFIVDVVDDRAEFSNATRFPMARHCFVLPGFAHVTSACAIGPNHYVAIMTRGHAFDGEVLAQVLESRAFYVGMIGSKTKKAHVYAALQAKGVGKDTLARVCCPIGLAIACETPQQIAVSVVAELLCAKGRVLGNFRSEGR